MYKIDIEGLAELRDFTNNLNATNLRAAVRMATNDTLRKARTLVRRAIQDAYNIKSSRINDNDSQKGIKLLLASTADPLNGRITAGHKPVNLSSLLRTRQTKTGVSIQIQKDGPRQVIQRAFKSDSLNGAVFARGRYSAFGFLFRHGIGERKNTAGSDTPITAINTISIATAALNTKAMSRYSQPIQDYHEEQLIRQFGRIFNR